MDHNAGELLYVPSCRSFFIVLSGSVLKCAFDHVLMSGQEFCLIRDVPVLGCCPLAVHVGADGRWPFRPVLHENHLPLSYYSFLRFFQASANIFLALRIGHGGILAPCLAQLASSWPSGVLVESIGDLRLYVERVADSLFARFGKLSAERRSGLLRKYDYQHVLELGDRLHFDDEQGFSVTAEGELQIIGV